MIARKRREDIQFQDVQWNDKNDNSDSDKEMNEDQPRSIVQQTLLQQQSVQQMQQMQQIPQIQQMQQIPQIQRPSSSSTYSLFGASLRSSNSSTTKRKEHKESGIFRRTSAQCKTKFQKAMSGRSRRSSVENMEDVQSTATSANSDMTNPFSYPSSSSQQPLSSSSSSKFTFMDRLAHPNKMLSNLKVSRYDTPQPILGGNSPAGAATLTSPVNTRASSLLLPRSFSAQPSDSQISPTSSSSMNVPFLPHNGRSSSSIKSHGPILRPSNSRSNLSTSSTSATCYEIREQNRQRLGSISSAADSGTDMCHYADADVDMQDIIEVDMIDKLDPMTYLPLELNALIFSYLDAPALRACQAIGPWKSLASDPLVWRGEYLRRYDRTGSLDPSSIQIGGNGLGRPDIKLQNWELMHTAREQVDANWTTGRGRAIYMAGHTDSVYCVQFDEKKIITGSRDRTIRVWDLNTHRCIKVIGGPSVRPAVSPRNLRTVDYPAFHHAEPSVNGTLYGHHIFHTPSDYHSASILCLQYDDEILVTGSSDNDLIVWDISTYEPIKRLKHHQGGVLDVAFDKKHIVSCSKDCTIVVWDRETLKPIKALKGHNGPVNAVQLRGNLLVSASGDGVARLWDLSRMQCVREFPAKERGLAAVEFSDDAKYVLAGGNDQLTYKFEVATGQEVLQYTGHTQLVRSLFLDTQNKRVISGSYDLDLRVYDYESGELIHVFPEWTTSWMLAAKCDYRRIVSTSQDGRILLIDFGFNQDGQKIAGIDLLASSDNKMDPEL